MRSSCQGASVGAACIVQASALVVPRQARYGGGDPPLVSRQKKTVDNGRARSVALFTLLPGSEEAGSRISSPLAFCYTLNRLPEAGEQIRRPCARPDQEEVPRHCRDPSHLTRR